MLEMVMFSVPVGNGREHCQRALAHRRQPGVADRGALARHQVGGNARGQAHLAVGADHPRQLDAAEIEHHHHRRDDRELDRGNPARVVLAAG